MAKDDFLKEMKEKYSSDNEEDENNYEEQFSDEDFSSQSGETDESDYEEPEKDDKDEDDYDENGVQNGVVLTDGPKNEKSGIKTKLKKMRNYLLPLKSDSQKEKIRKIIFLVSVIVLIICGIFIAIYLVNSGRNHQDNTNLHKMVDDYKNKDPKEYMKELQNEFPNVKFPEGIQLKYARLYALNQDTVGYITIPNTNIDFPIVKGKDNAYYLKHDFYKKPTNFGNPFMDYRNHIRTLDRNTILYGHNMRDGTVFAQLLNYKTLDGYKKAPVVQFNTIFKDYKWKVIAAFHTNADEEQDNGYVFNYIEPDMSTTSFVGYIQQIRQRSLFTTDVDIKASDKILTLSTCAYEFKNDRFVVVARLVRDGENANVDVSKAQMNSNPRYPQAWYDKHGKKNPYKNAAHWYPSQKITYTPGTTKSKSAAQIYSALNTAKKTTKRASKTTKRAPAKTTTKAPTRTTTRAPSKTTTRAPTKTTTKEPSKTTTKAPAKTTAKAPSTK